jgi:hypothetical protein
MNRPQLSRSYKLSTLSDLSLDIFPFTSSVADMVVPNVELAHAFNEVGL